MRKKTTLLLLLLLSLISLFAYWGIIKPSHLSSVPSEQVRPQNNALKIAVVNEDSGTTYNGQVLNIGELLTTSFATKTGYSVETVTRAIAEKGLDTNLYQMMVILPSKFSQDALALETSHPQQAVFQYQIKGDKGFLVKQAEQAVVDLKSHFNKDLIHIYFLSIIGNLQKAQTQVGDVITSEGKALSQFESQLMSPLSLYSKQFTGLSSSPNDLLSSYLTFQKAILDSNDAFTAVVDVNKTYTSELEEIKSLQEQWQESILKREASLKEYDEAVGQLTLEEQLTQLTSLNESLVSENSDPEIFSTTKTQSEQLKADVTALVERLTALNSQVDEQLAQYDKAILEAVKESIAKTDSADIEKQAESLGAYMASIEGLLIQQFDKDFARFQGFDNNTIAAMAISEADKQYLSNINAFALWYASAKQLPAPSLVQASQQGQRLDEVKTLVARESQKPQVISVEASEGEISDIILNIPAGYSLQSASLGFSPLSDGSYRLIPSSQKGPVTVEYVIGPVDNASAHLLTPLAVVLTVKTREDFAYFKPETETLVSSTASSNTSESTTKETTESETSETTGQAKPEVRTETKTQTVYKEDKKVIERTYQSASVSLPYAAYNGQTEAEAALRDFRPYFELAGLIQSYYGYDLASASPAFNDFSPQSGSLLGQFHLKAGRKEDLEAIVVNLIKDTTVTELKENLKVSDETIQSFEALAPKAEELVSHIESLKTNTASLLEKVGKTVENTKVAHETLTKKPTFVESEKRDNTDLVTVSLSINSDLDKLRSASQSLMDNTKAHQLASDGIKGQVERLATDVKALESEGEGLSGRVTELHGIMSKEYTDNTAFLKAFSTVLSNTKSGNSPNTVVYDYLSNPVDSSKIESVLGVATKQVDRRQDERSGFLLLLMGYIVSLGLSYILQDSDRAKWPRLMATKHRIHWLNGLYPFAFLTAGALGVAILVGAIAGGRLDLGLGQIMTLILLLFVLNQLFAHGINSLCHRFKGLGFVISLGLILLYLVSAGQLLDSHYVSHSHFLTYLSPLHYLESLLTAFLNQKEGWRLPFAFTMVLASVMSGLTLYLYRELKDKA